MFESGVINNEPWFCGDIPVGRGETVFIDTRNGDGIAEICNRLEKFISYKANTVNFVGSDIVDNKQDMYAMALEAIPRYNIDKNANIITFLRLHINNRLINKFKHATEHKRVACHNKIVREHGVCPNCKFVLKVEKTELGYCENCHAEESIEKPWKRYNLRINVLSLDGLLNQTEFEPSSLAADSSDVERSSLLEINNLTDINDTDREDISTEAQRKVDFMKVFNKFDEKTKEVVKLSLEGHGRTHIAKKLGMTKVEVSSCRMKFIKQYRVIEMRKQWTKKF